MYHQLLEEITSTLPDTPDQNERVRRAVAECDHYHYSDASDDYKEPAVRVRTPKGSSYVVFLAGEHGCCTCPDYRERAVVKSEIVACKHIVSTYVTGQWTVQPDAPQPAAAAVSAIDWRNAEPIGVEFIPGVGYVDVYAQEVGEAYGLHICNA